MKEIGKVPKSSGIYVIVNETNGRRYYGSSVNLKSRRWQHLFYLRSGRHNNKHLQRAWNKYGEESFTFSVVEMVDAHKLLSVEQVYINNNKGGYNIAPIAGSALGMKRTAAAKRRMSVAQKAAPQARLITINGLTQNLIDWCRETGFSPSIVLQRVNKLGWTFEEALSIPTWKRLTHNGLTLTVKEWSDKTGIAVLTIAARLRMGWDVDRALTEMPKHTKRLITFRGRTQSVRAWAREMGVPYARILSRLDRGWSAADALTNLPQLKTKKAK